MSSLLLPLLLLAPTQTEAPAVKVVSTHENRTWFADQGFNAATLGVYVEVKGPILKDGRKIGNLKITKARDDAGNDLILKPTKTAPQASSDQTFFRTVEEFERSFAKLQYNIQLKSSPRSSKTVSVTGSFDVLTGGTKVTAELPKVGTLWDTELKHEHLTATGAKLKLFKPTQQFGNANSNLVKVALGGTADATMLEINLLDKAGKKIQPFSWQSVNWTSPPEFHMYFQKVPDADSTVQVILLKGAKTTNVPFELPNVMLP